MKNTIYKSDNIRISVSTTANLEAVKLLENTIFGNKGIKYQHTSLTTTIEALKNPLFFYLYFDNELIGFYCLCKRIINSRKTSIDTFYGRYLTISPTYSEKGFGKILKREAVKYVENLSLKSVIFYSYIEQNNVHSLNISQKENFITAGLINSFVFFRFFPKKNKSVQKLSKDKIPEMKELLKNYYNEHGLVVLENIGYKENYFVLKYNNEIIAGVQANPVLWHIVKMDGLLGKLLKYISKVPFVNRIIRTNYEFLAIEGIYIKEEYFDNDTLYKLLEATLVHFNLNTILMQLDFHSPLAKKLNKDKKLGLVNKLNKPVTTHVMVKSHEDVQPISPIYISSFDFA